MNVILAVKPKYARLILAGRKEYEFRKAVFKDSVDTVFIYSSYPEKRIVAHFKVDIIHEDTPENLWRMSSDRAGLTEEEFFQYFGGREYGYAIRIRDLEILRIPLDPWEMIADFHPPQNYCYTEFPIESHQSQLPTE